MGWLIRMAYAACLQWQVDLDEQELIDRSIDGSSTDTWAATVRMQINNRIRHIESLRAPRVRYWLRSAAR